MPVTIRLPDGRPVTIQTDDPKAAAQAARRILAREAIEPNTRTKAAQSSGLGKVEKFQNNVTNRMAAGMSFGLSDVLPAALDAGITGVKNVGQKVLTGKDADYSAADMYAARRQMDKDETDAFAKAHPVVSGGAGLLGGLAAPGAAKIGQFVEGKIGAALPGVLGKVMASKTLPAVMARSAVAGAPIGALGGATSAAPGEEGKGALTGLETGAAVGAAAPVVLPTVARGVAKVGDMAKPFVSGAVRGTMKATGFTGNPAKRGMSELLAALRADKATPDEIRGIQNEWLKSGASSPSVLDLARELKTGGPNTLRLMTGSAMRAPGAAVEYGSEIASNLQPRASALVEKLVPPGSKAAATAQALKAAKSAQADELYPEGYKTPVTEHMTPGAASALDDEHGAGAVRAAMEAATARRDYAMVDRLKALLPEAEPIEEAAMAGGSNAPPVNPAHEAEDAAGLARAQADIAAYNQPRKNSLFTRIHRYGGLNLDSGGADLKGAVADLAESRQGLQPGTFHPGGKGYEDVAMHLSDEGMFGQPPPRGDDMMSKFGAAFEKEARGTPVYHPDTYNSDWDRRAIDLQRELSDAGIPGSTPNKKAAQLLFEHRNFDTAEARAVQAEADLNDPAGLEFDRLAAAKPAKAPPELLAKDLDRIQIAMGQRAAGLPEDKRAVAAGLYDRQKDLKRVLDAVPELAPARENFRSNTAREGALELGGQGMGTSSDKYADALEAHMKLATAPDNPYPVSAEDIQGAAQVGYAQSMRDAIERPAEGSTGVLNTISTSGRNIENQDATWSGSDLAANMRKGLKNEVKRVNTARLIDPTLNARTAGRLEALADQDKTPLTWRRAVLYGLSKLRQGAALTDEERDAIVKHGVGSMTPDMLDALPSVFRPLVKSTGYMGPAAAGAYQQKQNEDPNDIPY